MVFDGDFGVGVDIQEISSLADYSFSENKEFYERIYKKSEREYCLSKPLPAQHFAVRYAGKEAIIKAISPFITISYEHIEICNDESLRPFVRLVPPFNRDYSIKISLAHSDTQAIAFVIVERKSNGQQ